MRYRPGEIVITKKFMCFFLTTNPGRKDVCDVDQGEIGTIIKPEVEFEYTNTSRDFTYCNIYIMFNGVIMNKFFRYSDLEDCLRHL